MEAAVWGRLLAGGCQNFPSGFSQLGNILHFYIHIHVTFTLYSVIFCLFVCFSLVFIDDDDGKNRIT